MRVLSTALLLTVGANAIPHEPSSYLGRRENAPPGGQPMQAQERTLPAVNVKSDAPKANTPSDPIKPDPECGGSDWILTEANWKKADVDGQFKAWWDAKVKEKGESFVFYEEFGNEFLTQTGGFRCSTSVTCPPPACSNVRSRDASGKWSQPVQWAYFVSHAYSNMNNWMFVHAGAVNIAQETQNSLNTDVVRTFSGALEMPPKPPFNPVPYLFSILSVGITLTGGLAGPAVSAAVKPALSALSGVVTFAGKVDEKFTTPPPEASPESQTLQNLASTGVFVSALCDGMRKQLSWVTNALNAGQTLNGQNLVSLFSDGKMMYWVPGLDDRLKEYYKMMVMAKTINEIYTRNGDFMTRTPAVGGSCAEDKRYSPDLKYCDPRTPNVVYYYRGWRPKNHFFSDAFGWDQHARFGYTMQDIMRVSVDAYYLAGTPEERASVGGSNLYRFQDPSQHAGELANLLPADVGSKLRLPPTAFTIPICASDSQKIIGRYLESSFEDGKTGWPCTCGRDKPWPADIGGDRKLMLRVPDDNGVPDKPDTRLFWELTGWNAVGQFTGPSTWYGCLYSKDGFLNTASPGFEVCNNVPAAWPGAPDHGDKRPDKQGRITGRKNSPWPNSTGEKCKDLSS